MQFAYCQIIILFCIKTLVLNIQLRSNIIQMRESLGLETSIVPLLQLGQSPHLLAFFDVLQLANTKVVQIEISNKKCFIK